MRIFARLVLVSLALCMAPVSQADDASADSQNLNGQTVGRLIQFHAQSPIVYQAYVRGMLDMQKAFSFYNVNAGLDLPVCMSSTANIEGIFDQFWEYLQTSEQISPVTNAPSAFMLFVQSRPELSCR